MTQDKQKALFLLRFGLGLFLFMWGIDKIVSPEGTIKIFEMFYFSSINVTTVYVFAALEIVLALAIITGFKQRWSYGLGTLVHGFSTLSTYKQLLDPFKNHLFIAAVPVLTAFVALYMLRDEDTLWSLDH